MDLAATQIYLTPNHVSSSSPCYELSASNPNRIWKSGAVLEEEGQLLCLQIAYAVFVASIIYYILRPLNQPRFIAEILAGFTLSPLFLGHTIFGKKLLSVRGILNIETFADFGLMCYVLLSGLEMNLETVLRIRRKAMTIVASGFIIPAAIGAGLFSFMLKFYDKTTVDTRFVEDDKYVVQAYIFWSLSLLVTGFPILAKILTNLKLLNTQVGRISLTAAMISDAYGWFLFVILIPFASNEGKPVLAMISNIAFILILIFAARPLLTRYINHKMETDSWENSQLAIVVVLGGVICSCITDILGTHAIVGAFVYGLILPNGKFADLVMGKLDECVSGIFASLFFFRTGLTINLTTIGQQKYWPLMTLTIFLLFIPKVLSAMVSTFFFKVPPRDGLGIGILLNTKGVLALIILNIASDRKILSVVYFTVMVSAIMVMTVLVPILISAMYHPRRRFEMYKLRTVQKLRYETEFRILACVHTVRQAAGMVNLLKNCHATRISPMHIFGVRMMELRGRTAAANLFANNIEPPSFLTGSPSMARSIESESDNIANTFSVLTEWNNAVRVETTDAISVFETIHDDIYSLAQQKLTSLVLIPFHKQADGQGILEASSNIYRDINQNVLENPPCSVAVFIDRGLGTPSSANLRILTIFVGGADDREALAVTWRMVGHPGIKIDVVRMVLYGEAADTLSVSDSQWLSAGIMDEETQKLLDDEYLDSFRLKVVHNNDSVTYAEEDVGNGEELTSVMQEIGKGDYDLIIVGRGINRSSVVFTNFLEWCDNAELGVIGDIVASSNFGSHSSLLVVQQYEKLEGSRKARRPKQLPKAKSNASETLFV